MELIETLVATGVRPFEQLIRERHKHCGNCGGDHKLRVKLIVPVEAGGKEVESNAMLICRVCEMSADIAARLPGSEGRRRLINFWVSRRLHDRMVEGIAATGLKSMSELVRYLMTIYVADSERFDDVSRYQDSVVGDVKLNVWVPIDQYETFKPLVNKRGMSVTEAVKALFQMFDEEIVVRDKWLGDRNV
jgi:hypothetical protein